MPLLPTQHAGKRFGTLRLWRRCGTNARSPRERQLVSGLLRHGAEGLLIVPSADDYLFLEPDIRLGIRVVFLYRGPQSIDADVVSIDNEGASRRAVEHLIGYGHKRIAFVRDPTPLSSSAGRYEAYREALSANGLPSHEDMVRAVPMRAEAAEAAAHLLMAAPEPPTAILAENSALCIGAVKAVRKLAVRPALIGFDDFDLADLLEVSVVGCDPSEIGRVASELLFARLAGCTRPPQRIRIATKLLARGSGEVVAKEPA